MLSIEILHTKSDDLDGSMKNGLPRYIFWQMSYLPCHYLGVSVTLLEFPLLLMLPWTINAPEVIFYKPASHSTPQTKFMGFHVHVKRCLNPSDYFFLWNNRSNGWSNHGKKIITPFLKQKSKPIHLPQTQHKYWNILILYEFSP